MGKFWVHVNLSIILNSLSIVEPEVFDYENRNWEDIVTPIKVNYLERYLWETGYDQEKSAKLCQGFHEGFDIGYRGPTRRRNLSSNIPIRFGTKFDMWNKIMTEVQMGRYAGPFYGGPLFEHFVQSPLGLVPKSGGWTRLIFHLSFDFGKEDDERSINYHTPDRLCSVKYRDLDHAVNTCLTLKAEKYEELQKRFSQLAAIGIFVNEQDCSHEGIFFAKTDIMSAFRLAPVLPRQRFLLVMRCAHPVNCKVAFCIEKNLSFGASRSCAIFQSFSDALYHIIGSLTDSKFLVTNYLDDYLFI